MDYRDGLPKLTTLKWTTTPYKYYFEWVLLKELLLIYLHCTSLLYCSLTAPPIYCFKGLKSSI